VPRPRVEQTCQRLVLIGPRGSGKSTVGRLLAQALRWDFVDTDSLVEVAAGRSIAEIFAFSGEPAFRKLETEALKQALARQRCVISVGGGAVASRENRARLENAGLCVCLMASAEELQRRLDADPAGQSRRPPLTQTPGLEEMRQVLAQRRPFYEALAQQMVDTDGRTPQDVAAEILARLGAWPAVTEK